MDDWLVLDDHIDHDIAIGNKNQTKLYETHVKDGFREGYEAGRDSKLQSGFNEGFKYAANISFSLSTIHFLLESILNHEIECKYKTEIESLINQIVAEKKRIMEEWQLADDHKEIKNDDTGCGSDACACKSDQKTEEKPVQQCCSGNNSNCCKQKGEEKEQTTETNDFDIKKIEQEANNLISKIFTDSKEICTLSSVNPFRRL